MLYLALLLATRGAPLTREALTLAGILLASLAAVKFGPWALARYDSPDPKPFVLDEFAGQWTALLVLPGLAGGTPAEIALILLGQFLLFRILDVIKPPPARQFERLPQGWGVLTDDLMAGIYANLAGQIVWRLWPAAGWSAWLGL